MFLAFKDTFKDFIVFTPNDIKKYFPDFDKKNLVNWQKKGYIQRIRNNYYCFSDNQKSEEFLYFVANSIYHPSYISLESALSYYGIIPEGVYTITSITTLKTNAFNTDFTRFTYRNVKSKLYFGYQLINYKNQRFKIASLEKAVLDYLYLNSDVDDMSLFSDLRWNKSELLNINRELFNKYLSVFDSKVLNQRAGHFLNYLYA
jgi:predicted transcriptional regulator of viral defense system